MTAWLLSAAGFVAMCVVVGLVYLWLGGGFAAFLAVVLVLGVVTAWFNAQDRSDGYA